MPPYPVVGVIMSIDEQEFRRALGNFASGVTVVTAKDTNGMPIGMTVSAFSSVSLSPPLVLICLDKRARSLDSYCKGPFAVNILSEAQQDVSNLFASKKEDRFVGIDYSINADGVPVLDGAVAHLSCRVHNVVEGGDHVIILGHLTELASNGDARPLLYFRGGYQEMKIKL